MSYGDLEVQGAKMSWRLIDTAPEENDVIVSDGHAVGEARWHEGHGWYWAGNHPTDACGYQIYPTHWMPLPDPPSTKHHGIGPDAMFHG